MPIPARSRFTLWFIEAIIAVNVLYLSGAPLLSDVGDIGYGAGRILEGAEQFLTGNGPYTLSFWLRLVSIVAAFVILFSFPRKSAGKRSEKARCWADFTLALLFFYVVSLSIIFGSFGDYLWIQPVVYALLMSIAYVANSWWYSDDGS